MADRSILVELAQAALVLVLGLGAAAEAVEWALGWAGNPRRLSGNKPSANGGLPGASKRRQGGVTIACPLFVACPFFVDRAKNGVSGKPAPSFFRGR
jgi:hypothetical protein